MKVNDVLKCLEKLAPIDYKMDFDNVGLLVGDPDGEVSKILISLDITDSVISEASDMGAELIVSHHPLMFDTKSVRADDLTGRKILALAKSGISAICMHTNLDVAHAGVNDALADALGLQNIETMIESGVDVNGKSYGLGRIGEIPAIDLPEFLNRVKSSLNANGLRYVSAGAKVHKVAVCGGSGGSELQSVFNLGCDTYVTADVKYNVFLDAKELGINLIDAGHFPTENVVVPYLYRYLSSNLPELSIKTSEVHKQPELFF